MNQPLINRDFTPTPSGRETPDLAVPEVSVTMNKFQKVEFNVIANDTVRFNHGTGLAIDFVPMPAHL